MHRDLIRLDQLGDIGVHEMTGLMRLHTQEVARLTALTAMHIRLEEKHANQFMRDCAGYDLAVEDLLVQLEDGWAFTPLGVFLVKVCAKLHDIGILFFRHSYYLERPLEDEEYQIQKLHANLSRIVIRSWQLQDPDVLGRTITDFIADSAAAHQERFDGSGYPDGCVGTEISLIGRILAITDAFSAMLNPRPFCQAYPMDECVERVEAEAGKQFDPELVSPLLKLLQKLEPEFCPSAQPTRERENFTPEFLRVVQSIDFKQIRLGAGDRARMTELREVVAFALARQRTVTAQSLH
jgi:HD-GYP domain-containing protein (c-di-GMP phosphodiesterase class II)